MRLAHGIARAASGLAATLFIAAAVSWPIGYWRPVAVVAYGPAGRPIAVIAGAGSIHLFVTNIQTGPLTAWTVDGRLGYRTEFDQRRDELIQAVDHRLGDSVRTVAGPSIEVHHNPLLGAGFGRAPFKMAGTWFGYASVPAWLAVIVFGWLPVRALRRAVRRRRWRRRGACVGCGYDLRESTDRCPECGLVVAATV